MLPIKQLFLRNNEVWGRSFNDSFVQHRKTILGSCYLLESRGLTPEIFQDTPRDLIHSLWRKVMDSTWDFCGRRATSGHGTYVTARCLVTYVHYCCTDLFTSGGRGRCLTHLQATVSAFQRNYCDKKFDRYSANRWIQYRHTPVSYRNLSYLKGSGLLH
jgi:hypothetical protein